MVHFGAPYYWNADSVDRSKTMRCEYVHSFAEVYFPSRYRPGVVPWTDAFEEVLASCPCSEPRARARGGGWGWGVGVGRGGGLL